MDNQVIHFQLRKEFPDSPSDCKDWYTDSLVNNDGEPIGLCNSGLMSYVDLPSDCEEVDLVLSAKDSDKRTFLIQRHEENDNIYYDLDTDANLHFFHGINGLMKEMHEQGLIYLHFEYEE